MVATGLVLHVPIRVAQVQIEVVAQCVFLHQDPAQLRGIEVHHRQVEPVSTLLEAKGGVPVRQCYVLAFARALEGFAGAITGQGVVPVGDALAEWYG